MKDKRLIVGLGNPGKEYEKSRHNLGFRVVENLAKLHGASFVKEKSFPGFYAKTAVGPYEVHYLMPLSYMNDSGMAMRRCMEYFKIGFQSILIVADDVAIPYGTLRLRSSGSSGGHNGLKSIQEWLGTDRYSRLRVGVGVLEEVPLKKYVLDDLSAEEELKWPKVEEAACELIQAWIGDAALSKTIVLETVERLKSVEDKP